jgi:CheY-like chemotaxis protein
MTMGAERILLVEDNAMNLDMLKRRLERRGFEVLVAQDGAEGVRVAVESQPRLVLMDISLPVMDGWEATRQLKAHPLTAGIPILVLTAHALSTDREKCFAAGADDYDTKPVDFKRLLDKISALIGEDSTP